MNFSFNILSLGVGAAGRRAAVAFILLLALTAAPVGAAIGEAKVVRFAAAAANMPLVAAGAAAPLYIEQGDWPGVRRAAADLQADIARVTGREPTLHETPPAGPGPVVLIGTIGRSPAIDALVRAGKLDVAGVAGQWESWVTTVVSDPWPGVGQALVIAGSDKRGTIYGIYDISEQIGVSPWYWWADVPATHHDALYIAAGRVVHPSPAVKYRGIFLNDEAPDLTSWVREKFGEVPVSADPPRPRGIANYNSEFYRRIFEVLLRLRGNYLWPAMWDNAFNEDDPRNAALADEYGIVMGTSHQEPMLRAQKEWDRRYLRTIGTWNYAKEPKLLEDFWRAGVRRNRDFESIVTMGLRGANDTEMAPGGPPANRALLEQIVDRQRTILREEINPDLTRVPQLWCLYKEVQDYYEAGMRAPDDVTLLWAEDNWGNVRRLPTAAERRRAGGAGIYYHFDYHGSPRSYQWINANPLPKVWEQMSLAAQYGADRVWIVNVGHFKGYELPTEFFLNLAWAPTRWQPEHLGDFSREWAAREFGPEHAAEIADIVSKYAKYNGRRKPELLAPDTYSLLNYREAETVLADFQTLVVRATAIAATLPAASQDAFYELVLFPVRASALVNELYIAAGRNILGAQQGRASTNARAAEVRALFQRDLDLMSDFNHRLGAGRWDHFMDQSHLGYTTWRDPPKNSLDAIPLQEITVPAPGALGVVPEGATLPAARSRLPAFDVYTRREHYIELYDRGAAPVRFSAHASAPWIQLSAVEGSLGPDARLSVGINWDHVPPGTARGEITIGSASESFVVDVTAVNPATPTRAQLEGFVESEGVVAIEPEHYMKRTDVGAAHWTRVDDYGRTLSGLRADAPTDAPAATPGPGSPSVEYQLYLFDSGDAAVTVLTAPTLNFIPDRPVRYALAVDDAPPQVMTLVPRGYTANNHNPAWDKSVTDNAHASLSHHVISNAGYHTLRIWMVDPAVVLQKIIVDLGGLRPSYLGPPESFWQPAANAAAATQGANHSPVRAVGDRASGSAELPATGR